MANCCFHSQHVWLLLFERKTQWSIKQNKIIIVCGLGTSVKESGHRSLSTCPPKFITFLASLICPAYTCSGTNGVTGTMPPGERRRLSAYTIHPVGRQGCYCTCMLCASHPAFWESVVLLCNCNSFCTRETEESRSGVGLVAQSRQTLCSSRIVAPQAPLSIEFSRQEYWGGLPLPSSEDLSDPGIKPGSSTLQADSLPTESPGQPKEGRSASKSGGKICSFLPAVSMIVFTDLT